MNSMGTFPECRLFAPSCRSLRALTGGCAFGERIWAVMPFLWHGLIIQLRAFCFGFEAKHWVSIGVVARGIAVMQVVGFRYGAGYFAIEVRCCVFGNEPLV